MNSGILRQSKPGAKQLYLDPRSKILLCLTVSFVMLAGDTVGIMRWIIPLLALFPLLCLVILKRYRIALYYAVMFLFASFVPRMLMPHLPPILNLLFTGIIAMFTKLIPGMSMFSLLLYTTSVSEFTAALDALKVSKQFIVPVSVMFRFFPTIAEEYAAIRDAMRLRQIGSIRNPLQMLEYRLVPLLIGLVTIGNELTASALTRGLDAPLRRTNLCPIGFQWQDRVVWVICGLIVLCFALSKLYGI